MAEDAPNGTAGRTARTAQKKMTDADRAALLEILKRPDVRKNGKIHIPTVTKMTGLTYQTIYGFMRNDRYMAAQLAEANPGKLVPGEADQVDSTAGDPPTGITISNAQFDEYKAMIRQNRKMLAADWEKLGMTESAGKRMEHYVTLGTTPTSMILRATTGQLISNLELLDRIVKGDCERVLNGNIPQELGKNGEPRPAEEVERDWRYMVYAGMKLQLDMFSHVHKVQALMARVMKELHLMNGGQAPKAKGEFLEVVSKQAASTPVSERDASN